MSIDYLKELQRCQHSQGPLKRTANATGVSCASIKRLWKEKADIRGLLFQLQQRDTDTSDAC